LKAVNKSEATLSQFASLGLEWGESAEVDQNFTNVMQNMYSRMDEVRQLRLDAMYNFDMQDFMDDEDNGMRFPPAQAPGAWHDLMPPRREQQQQQQPGCGPTLGDIAKRYQNAPMQRQPNYTSNPNDSHTSTTQQMLLQKIATSSMTRQHNARDSSEISNLLNRSPSQVDTLQEALRAAPQATMPSREVKPRNGHVPIDWEAVSKNDNVDTEFQQGLCQAIHQHVLGKTFQKEYNAAHELERSIPNMPKASNGHRLLSHPEIPVPFDPSAFDDTYRLPSDENEDADAIFRRGMSLLFPSFFLDDASDDQVDPQAFVEFA
jgi:hypothetical protein